MPEQKLQFLRGDRAGTDTEYRNHLPENMNAIVAPVFDVEGYLSTHPGYEQYIIDDDIGSDRGALYNERFEEHYRVSGNNLIQVNTDKSLDVLGAITGATSLRFLASMPYSFQTQAIFTDTKMWLYDPVNGLVQVTDPDLGNPLDGTWVDGYYFMTDGEYLYHTDLDDESAIDPLKYATSEFSPDPTRGVGRTQDNQVIVFNRYTTEFFQNAASEQFAFTRVQGKATNCGIIGTHCKIQVEGNWYTLGSAKDAEPTFNIIGAGTYTNFSCREVDEILQTYEDTELQLTSFAVRKADQQKYLYVQMLRHTLLFNITAAQAVTKDYAWSILTFGTEDDVQVIPTAIPRSTFYYQALNGIPRRAINPVWDPRLNLWVCGDVEEGQLNVIVEETAGQRGFPTQLMVSTPFVYLETQSIDEIKIRTLPGQADGIVGAFISLTYDGVTYSKEWSMKISAGAGDYNARFEVRRLGFIRDYVGLRIRIVSLNKVALCDARVVYS